MESDSVNGLGVVITHITIKGDRIQHLREKMLVLPNTSSELTT
ncbi:hypothetical protein [Nostoc sp.]